MKNETKAREFAIDRGHDNQSITEAFVTALDMAEWKDKQMKRQCRIIRNHWQKWAKKQIKNQEQTLLWTVEHILDRLCIEGEAREIAIKEFTNDLLYYNEKENDSKE